MKEEELIKKLESVDVPEIELQSHRRRLRMALLNAGYLRRQRRVTILDLAKSKVKGGVDIMIRGLVSKQSVWKTAVVSMLALALLIGLSLAVLSPGEQSAYAQAAKIAQNSPQVRAALGGGKVKAVKVIKVVDDKGTVICWGEVGAVTAEVDLKLKKVETVTMLRLTEADKEKAINIAKADPRVKEFLDKGAVIGKVSPTYSFSTRVNPETGETEEFAGELVRVEIKLGERMWVAYVDLAQGKVIRLLKKVTSGDREFHSGPEGKVEYFHIVKKGSVEEPVFHVGKGGIERNTQ